MSDAALHFANHSNIQFRKMRSLETRCTFLARFVTRTMESIKATDKSPELSQDRSHPSG
jgi:hypothetical protein